MNVRCPDWGHGVSHTLLHCGTSNYALQPADTTPRLYPAPLRTGTEKQPRSTNGTAYSSQVACGRVVTSSLVRKPIAGDKQSC